MKKILSIVLALVMMLSLCACNPSNAGSTGDSSADTAGSSSAGTLLVGYGKADITPVESVPLQGYGATEKRMSTGFKSYMYQIALAVTDSEGNTAVVIAADACWLRDDTAKEIRQQIQNEMGVPADNIIISACHQHSAPDMYNSKAPSGITYRDEVFVPGAVEAAKAAMENRAPATVQTATVETENLNFVRHYVMSDGSYAGDNFGDWNLTPVKHATEVDNDLQLIKFIREGQTTQNGKEAKDIILANFQLHPLRGTGGNQTTAHSDLIGVYRDELEAELDCLAIYFSGASGNVAPSSRISEENITADYQAQGKALAKCAISAEGTYTDVDFDGVKATKMSFTGECNHTEDHRLAEAEEAYQEWYETGKTTLVKKYGFESQYHCSAIRKHAQLPETKTFEIFALSFGDVAFIGAPYEMFDTSGMKIKEDSPFEVTIVSTIANGGQEYLPSQMAWDYGCYEQYNSNYVAGTAEKLVDAYLGMLNELHGE